MATSSSSDEWDQEVECAAALLVLEERKKRKYWVHPINSERHIHGEYHTLMKLIELDDNSDRLHMYFRMNKKQFENLHSILEMNIKKISTTFRKAISIKERLAICLRFLATGNSFRSLGFSYRMGFSTVRKIVKEVCQATWQVLKPIVMPSPTTAMWKEIAQSYQRIWNFPHCLGALDGKHINIRCPINAGSEYYNYKGAHSIALLALVDANYKFIVIDVGAYGKNSDGAIFSNSLLGKSLANGTFNLPADEKLTANGEELPYIIVGDEAFPLKSYLLRPYSRRNINGDEHKKIYNYRLSRARIVVENSFGILAARWRIFPRYMEVQPETAQDIILAAVCLHNMLCDKTDFEPENEYSNGFNSCFTSVPPLRQNCTERAIFVRDKFKEYFTSEEGSVSWQTQTVRRGRIY